MCQEDQPGQAGHQHLGHPDDPCHHAGQAGQQCLVFLPIPEIQAVQVILLVPGHLSFQAVSKLVEEFLVHQSFPSFLLAQLVQLALAIRAVLRHLNDP